MHKPLLLTLASLLTAAPALAADTTEPFGLGLSDAEGYLSLGGLDDEAGKSLGFVGVLGAGLTERLSFSLAWSEEGDDDLRLGGQARAGGLFYNALNTPHFDLDVAVGIEGGDHALHLGPSVELNLDSADDHSGWGLYLRAGVVMGPHPEPTEADVEEGPIKTAELNPGLYLTIAEGSQLLVEHQLAFEVGEAPEGGGRFALGYNHVLDDIEVISEVGYEEGAVDLSIGFIATLPTGAAAP